MKCNPVHRVQGSGYEKPSDTESTKQLQERIVKLNAERAKQDAIWTTPVADSTGQGKTIETKK